MYISKIYKFGFKKVEIKMYGKGNKERSLKFQNFLLDWQ